MTLTSTPPNHHNHPLSRLAGAPALTETETLS